MIDISFVILTCNSQAAIGNCVKSYARSIDQAGLQAEFIIVDNGSKDKTLEILNKAVIPSLPASCKAKVIALPKNLGTTKSRNIALRKIAGPFCVICDSDTEFLKGDWEQSLKRLKEDKSAGILAGHLYWGDRSTQHSVKRFPTLGDKLLKLKKTFLRVSESTTDYYADFPWEEIRPVDTAISAFWLFRRELLDEVGFLDEKIFYAPEDLDFCLRVWKARKKVLFYPGIEILHLTQRISHAKPLSPVALSHFFGLLYYFKKHNYWFSRKKIYAQIPACAH